MDAAQINRRPTAVQSLVVLAVSAALFAAVYYLAGWYTSGLARVGSFVLPFERSIPFLPLMIIPYMSSGILFAAVFFCCRSAGELRLLTRRINFVTLISGLFFFIVPMTHTFLKPQVESPVLVLGFRFLNQADTPFNQFPSLHIAYALIYWSVFSQLRSKLFKVFMALWIVLMCAATLAVYQHHLIDLTGALVVVALAFLLFPRTKCRNARIAACYRLGSACMLLAGVLLWGCGAWMSAVAGWIALTLWLVGWAYTASDGCFLKDERGRICLWKKIIYAPYLLAYVVIRQLFCRNSATSVVAVLPSVYMGPRLSGRQMHRLGFDRPGVTIVDLSAEMEESRRVRKRACYFSLPMLDTGTISEPEFRQILERVVSIAAGLRPGEKMYLHCLMGYSRAAFVAACMVSRLKSIPLEEASQELHKIYPNARFPEYLVYLTDKIE